MREREREILREKERERPSKEGRRSKESFEETLAYTKVKPWLYASFSHILFM